MRATCPPNSELVSKGCMDFLRKATYEVGPSPVDTNHMGREIDKQIIGAPWQ